MISFNRLPGRVCRGEAKEEYCIDEFKLWSVVCQQGKGSLSLTSQKLLVLQLEEGNSTRLWLLQLLKVRSLMFSLSYYRLSSLQITIDSVKNKEGSVTRKSHLVLLFRDALPFFSSQRGRPSLRKNLKCTMCQRLRSFEKRITVYFVCFRWENTPFSAQQDFGNYQNQN